VSPDPAAGHAEFLVRRRRRYQRLAAGGALAAVLALTAGALALTNHHTPKTVPVAANGQTAEPQPGPEETGLAPPSSTTPTSSPIPGLRGSTTVRASAPTSQPALPSTTIAHSTPSSGVPAMCCPPPPGSIIVNNADNGKSYVLTPGQHLVVQLQPEGYTWTEPASSNSSALPRDSGRTWNDGSASATFQASALGNADVTSEGRSIPPPCATATPRCMVPDHVMEFKISVTVAG
jgi:hypothetical protein